MPSFTTRPEIRGTFGAVASTHWIASAVGMRVLEKGGNAFDAAVAVSAVTAITDTPSHAGLGGTGYGLMYDAKKHQVRALDFRGVFERAVQMVALGP